MLQKIFFWGSVAAVIIALLCVISEIIAPFFISMIIAYLLNPVAHYLSLKCKLNKSVAVSVVFTLFASIFVIAMLFLLPIISRQILSLITNIPVYKRYLSVELVPLITTKIASLDPSVASTIKSIIQNFVNNIFSIMSGFANNFWHYTMATINMFTLTIITPVISYYFLENWDRMVASLESLLPLKNKIKIKEILGSINDLLGAYIRGQLNVCILLSCFYGICLSVVGVDSWLLLGLLSGFLVIIPFIGAFISFIITMIISYFSLGLTIKLIYVIIIYSVGAIFEGYVLTPRIIGNNIGLHPLWIIFSVFACGSLFGFVGIFFAIPIAGIIKILLFHSIEYYKNTSFYKD